MVCAHSHFVGLHFSADRVCEDAHAVLHGALLLGVAEAGFFPGLIVYFTHWFTSADRARALSGLVMAVPFSLALGAPVSALLLDVNWLGWAGWKWLFILEGFPAVLLGVGHFALDDGPSPRMRSGSRQRNATHLEELLAAEARAKETAARSRSGRRCACAMSGCSPLASSQQTRAATRLLSGCRRR